MYYTLYNSANTLQPKVASLTAVAALFTELYLLLAVVYLAIVIDFFLGYTLSKKVKNEIPGSAASGKLESSKWWHTIVKVRDASLVLGLAYVFDLFILQSENCYLARLAAGFIAGAELLSVVENLAYLYPWAKFLRKYVKNKIEKHLDIDIDEA